MLGVAGMLIPDVLNLPIPAWYENDKVMESSGWPFNSLLMTMFFLFNFSEIKRWQDMKKPGSQGEPGSFLGFESQFSGTGVSGYPGGAFDPMGMSKGNLPELKQKEIKNARLAMVAFLGFVAQYGATGKGPVDCLVDHIASPWAVNFTTNGVSVPVTIF
jgi:hypothetical protein